MNLDAIRTAWSGRALRCGALSCAMQGVVYVGAILASKSFSGPVLLILLVLSFVALLLSVVAWLHTWWWALATCTAALMTYAMFVLLYFY